MSTVHVILLSYVFYPQSFIYLTLTLLVSPHTHTPFHPWRPVLSTIHQSTDYIIGMYLDALIWTAVKPLVGVICVSLPTLRPILSYLLPHRFRLTSHSNTAHSSASKKQNALVTIGSYSKSRRINKQGMGYTTFDEADEGSQKGLNISATDPINAEHDPRYGNSILVRQGIELSHYRS